MNRIHNIVEEEKQGSSHLTSAITLKDQQQSQQQIESEQNAHQFQSSEIQVNQDNNVKIKKNVKTQLDLVLDKQNVHQGDIISGKILISTNQQISPDFLNLKLKVKEEAFFEKEYEQNNKILFGSFQGRINWFNHSYPIRSFAANSVLMPNVHEFPFQFQIDKNHPISFYYQNDNIDTIIQTKLKAEFKCKKKKLQTDSKIIKILQNKSALDKVSHKMHIFKERKTLLQSCLCFFRGETSMRIFLEKNIFKPGEEVTGYIDVNNQNSSLSINKINFEFTQIINVKDLKGNEGYFRNVEQQIIFDTNLITINGGEIKEKIPVKFTIPKNIELSINFKLVQSTFELSVIGEMSWVNFLFEQPFVKCTIWVYEFDEDLELIHNKSQQQQSQQNHSMLGSKDDDLKQLNLNNLNEKNDVDKQRMHSPFDKNIISDKDTTPSARHEIDQPVNNQNNYNKPNILKESEVINIQNKKQNDDKIKIYNEEQNDNKIKIYNEEKDNDKILIQKNISSEQTFIIHHNQSVDDIHNKSIEGIEQIIQKMQLNEEEKQQLKQIQEVNSRSFKSDDLNAQNIIQQLKSLENIVEEQDENQKPNYIQEIIWARAMYYHPSEDKLIYTKPVFDSYEHSLQQAMKIKLRLNENK